MSSAAGREVFLAIAAAASALLSATCGNAVAALVPGEDDAGSQYDAGHSPLPPLPISYGAYFANLTPGVDTFDDYAIDVENVSAVVLDFSSVGGVSVSVNEPSAGRATALPYEQFAEQGEHIIPISEAGTWVLSFALSSDSAARTAYAFSVHPFSSNTSMVDATPAHWRSIEVNTTSTARGIARLAAVFDLNATGEQTVSIVGQFYRSRLDPTLAEAFTTFSFRTRTTGDRTTIEQMFDSSLPIGIDVEREGGSVSVEVKPADWEAFRITILTPDEHVALSSALVIDDSGGGSARGDDLLVWAPEAVVGAPAAGMTAGVNASFALVAGSIGVLDSGSRTCELVTPSGTTQPAGQFVEFFQPMDGQWKFHCDPSVAVGTDPSPTLFVAAAIPRLGVVQDDPVVHLPQ